MSDLAVTEALTSIHNFTTLQFLEERERVIARTAIERQWIAQWGEAPFQNDGEIVAAAQAEKLVRVVSGTGFIAIRRLREWSPAMSDPSHPQHYSAPYLRPEATQALETIGQGWAANLGPTSEFRLSVTSLVRSAEYQTRLSQRPNKLTVPTEVGDSSHMYGLAFDIDGCGLYKISEQGQIASIHPRLPAVFSEHEPYIQASREVLRTVLEKQAEQGAINFVEELPDTQEHCFHVCTQPAAL